MQYALALVRQVWNRARDAGVHDLPCPARKVKLDTKKHDSRKRADDAADGVPCDRVPFGRAVNALGLNDGIADRRQKVVFHTLRHTYASWLVAAGTDLYTVQRLLGHQSIALTERYAHLAPDTLKAATRALEAYASEEQPRLAVVPGGRRE